MTYTEQITFLLFLKMADELTKPPYNRRPMVPPEQGWRSLLERDGDELEVHYRHILAQEIADDLQTALDQFTAVAGGLRG